MLIDLNKIKKLLASDITGYRIGQETTVKQQNYDRYKKGLSNLEDMPIRTAIELQKYINAEENKMRYTVVLNTLKNKVGTEIPVSGDHEIIVSETLGNTLNAVSHDVDGYEKGIAYVEYLIYFGTDIEKAGSDFWSETDYSISYIKVDNKFEIHEIAVSGLEYKNKTIKKFEDYKILFDSFEDFADDMVHRLESDFKIEKVPNYETLREPALTLLKKGRINDAKEHLEHEILDFNDIK